MQLKIWYQRRSNHAAYDFEDVFKWISVWMGIKYAMWGGHWGPGLQYAFSEKCRTLKHPFNDHKIHPIISEFTHHDTDEIDIKIYHRSESIQIYKPNKLPRVLFKINGDNQDDDEDEDVIDYDQEQTDIFWEIVKESKSESKVEQILEQNFETDDTNLFQIRQVTSVIINDGRKSNWINFDYGDNKKKKGWNYWFKIYYTQNDNDLVSTSASIHYDNNKFRIINISYIFRIYHYDENKYVYLCMGDIYNYKRNAVKQYNKIDSMQTDYTEYMDTFNKTRNKESNSWCIVNSCTILESLVIIHNHVVIPQIGDGYPTQTTQTRSGRTTLHYPFQIDWIKAMQPYYQSIINGKNTDNIPCGPILVCIEHNDLLCTDCHQNNKKKRSVWYCNDKASTNSEFIIWDSKHGFIPGIFRSINSKIIGLYQK